MWRDGRRERKKENTKQNNCTMYILFKPIWNWTKSDYVLEHKIISTREKSLSYISFLKITTTLEFKNKQKNKNKNITHTFGN